MIDIFRISKRKYYGTVVPLVSFSELSVNFQDPDIMLLRDLGYLFLSSSPQGVQLDYSLILLSTAEFLKRL